MTTDPVTVKISPNDKGTPLGKIADIELPFDDGPLAGLKLVGFAAWRRHDGAKTLTMPARAYQVSGERRSFALLRPITDAAGQDRLRDFILEELERLEKASAIAS